jgi:hypothetical protein
MPTIERLYTLTVTPEQFLNACSLNELQEVGLLLDGAMDRKLKQEGIKLDKSVFNGDGI